MYNRAIFHDETANIAVQKVCIEAITECTGLEQGLQG